MTKQTKKSKARATSRKSKKNQLTWSEMSAGRKAAVLVTGAVQMVLAATAWRDLAKRPAGQVRGPKGLWAAIIAVNWVGPIAYFIRGRQDGSETRPAT